MKEELNDDAAVETVTLEEEQLARLDDFFSDLPSEYSIVITREEPKEYKGFLDEFIVDDLDRPLSIRDLIQKWGGKVLKVLVRAPGGKFVRRFIVPLRSYEPLTNGIPCGRPYPSTAEMARNAPNDYLELLKAVQGTIKEIAPKQATQSTQQGDSTAQMLIQLLVPMMTAAMQNMTRPTPQTSMSELMGMMVKMKDFLGDSPGNGDADQVLPGILKIGEALVTQRGAPQAQEPNPNRNRLTPPRITTIPNPNPAPLSIAPVPAPNPAPAPESDKIPIDKLPDFVGSLPPEVLSGLMIEVLSRMDENKREALTDQLLSALGIEAEEIEAPDSKSISAVNRTPPGQGE